MRAFLLKLLRINLERNWARHLEIVEKRLNFSIYISKTKKTKKNTIIKIDV